MARRNLVAWAVAGVVGVLLVVAASSAQTRLWVTPPLDVGTPTVDTVGPAVTIAPQAPEAPHHGSGPAWGNFLSQLVGALLVLALVVAVVVLVRAGWLPRLTRPRTSVRIAGDIGPLPEVPDGELTIDLPSARAALAGGAPRNAIVACWMQLESDAALAGLPRAAAETSAEYVERVVAESSVDPAPIGDLAALYREARFSRHELTDDHRQRAISSLNRVEAALARVEVPV